MNYHPYSGSAGYIYANEYLTGHEKAGERRTHRRPHGHLKSFIPEVASSESLMLPYDTMGPTRPPGLSCAPPALTPDPSTTSSGTTSASPAISTRAPTTQSETASCRKGVRASFLSSARSTKSIDHLLPRLDSGWIEDQDPFAAASGASSSPSFRIARSGNASHWNQNRGRDDFEGGTAPALVSQWYNYKSGGTSWRKRIKKRIERVLRGIRSLMHSHVRPPWGARSRVGDTYN